MLGDISKRRWLLANRICFDPCSPGSCWATRHIPGHRTEARGFRSLFSWIMLGDFDVGSAANCPARVSILVLLDHAGRRLSFWLANVGAMGFDPCSPGSCWATRTPAPRRTEECTVSILVLLDHAGRLQHCLMRKLARQGFDPCSPGSCWATVRPIRLNGLAHVSILVLLDHAGRLLRRCLCGGSRVMFRSLFSWIMLGDFDSRFHVSLVVRFRSLFSWIMLGDRGTDLRVVHELQVSILVLLDHAGRHLHANGGTCGRHLVSILVLLDHAGRLVPRLVGTVDDRRFDPCSPGSCWATPKKSVVCLLGDCGVSILVLLDHAGRPEDNRGEKACQVSFDPCSPGSCWAT